MTRQHAIIGIVALIALYFSNGCRDYPDSGPLAVELWWEIPSIDDAGVSDAETDVNADEDALEPGMFGECEQAGVVRFDYQLEDMSDCIKYSDGWTCRVVDYFDRVPCEEITILNFDWLSGGDYLLKIWGYDEDGYDLWRAICPDLDKEGSFYVDGAFYVDGKLYMDGSKDDRAYPCEVSFIPRAKRD
jgi:hypothetical protein